LYLVRRVVNERRRFGRAELRTGTTCESWRLTVARACSVVAASAHQLDVRDLLGDVVPFTALRLERLFAKVAPRIGPRIIRIVGAGVVTARDTAREVSAGERSGRFAVLTARHLLAVAHREQTSI
jgi:hypothetical protein